MGKRRATQPIYTINCYADPDAQGSLRFTFVPRSTRQAGPDRQPPRSMPEYIVSVHGCGNETGFDWIMPPTRQSAREEFEGIARQLVTARHAWLGKLSNLVATVKGWAEELDWATRVVDKTMEDAEIGNYKAPGLLLQNEAVRLFLEPVARVAPDTEGVVDLYLMPSYDDIASLYYYDKRWNVHYRLETEPAARTVLDAEAKPLTKATLRRVFDEMKAHAK